MHPVSGVCRYNKGLKVWIYAGLFWNDTCANCWREPFHGYSTVGEKALYVIVESHTAVDYDGIKFFEIRAIFVIDGRFP